jgi:hypothetical protein
VQIRAAISRDEAEVLIVVCESKVKTKVIFTRFLNDIYCCPDWTRLSLLKSWFQHCLLYCRDVRLNQLAAMKPPNRVNLPKRIYYDSVFKVPRSDAVWLVDVDSDDEARDHISFLEDTEAVREKIYVLSRPCAA